MHIVLFFFSSEYFWPTSNWHCKRQPFQRIHSRWRHFLKWWISIFNGRWWVPEIELHETYGNTDMQPRQQKLVTETSRSEIHYDFISSHLGGKLILDIDISKYSYFESRQFLSTSAKFSDWGSLRSPQTEASDYKRPRHGYRFWLLKLCQTYRLCMNNTWAQSGNGRRRCKTLTERYSKT